MVDYITVEETFVGLLAILAQPQFYGRSAAELLEFGHLKQILVEDLSLLVG